MAGIGNSYNKYPSGEWEVGSHCRHNTQCHLAAADIRRPSGCLLDICKCSVERVSI